ncbi:hypothetical protein CR513_20436, partial [Mucuna pruriens]
MTTLTLVEKLNLPTLVHLRLYKLHRLSDKGEMVSLAFTLSKYIHEILCVVVPMEATHILLGRIKGDPQIFFSKRGQEALIVSRREVKRVLLARKESVYLFPTNMCFHVSSPLFILLTGFREMLKSFKELFSKDIPKGLPSIRGIEYHIDFTLGATLPNRVAYKLISLLKKGGFVKVKVHV